MKNISLSKNKEPKKLRKSPFSPYGSLNQKEELELIVTNKIGGEKISSGMRKKVREKYKSLLVKERVNLTNSGLFEFALGEFEKFLGVKLRDDQLLSVIKTIISKKGYFDKPTGIGKSYEQIFTLYYSALETPGYWVGLLNSPRINLTDQNAKGVSRLFLAAGIEIRIVLLHSGGTKDDMEDFSSSHRTTQEFMEIVNTTNSEEVREALEYSKQRNQKVLIFSTYHSCQKISEEISIIVNDEMHNITQKDFFNNVKKLSYKKMFGWTATPIFGLTEDVDSRGNNNRDFYGDLLSRMTYGQAVLLKIICPLRIHIMNGSSYTTEEIDRNFSKIVNSAHSQHRTQVLLDSSLERSPKTLVHAKDSIQIKSFIDSKEERDMIKNDIHVYMLGSNEDIQFRINGETQNPDGSSIKRSDFFQRLRTSLDDPNQEVIVFHIDMISEGIDLPGFTGGILMNPTSKWYLIVQRIGRSGRLDPMDRGKENGWVKPYNYLILPNLCPEQKEGVKEVTDDLVKALRSMDLNPSELFKQAIGDYQRGNDDSSGGFDQDPPAKKKKKRGSTIIGSFTHHIEEEEECKIFDRVDRVTSKAIEGSIGLSDLRKIFDF